MTTRDISANVSEGIASLSPASSYLWLLMLGELLAQHEALVAKLIEQGLLDAEELDEFSSRYSEWHLPAAPAAHRRGTQVLSKTTLNHFPSVRSTSQCAGTTPRTPEPSSVDGGRF